LDVPSWLRVDAVVCESTNFLIEGATSL